MSVMIVEGGRNSVWLRVTLIVAGSLIDLRPALHSYRLVNRDTVWARANNRSANTGRISLAGSFDPV